MGRGPLVVDVFQVCTKMSHSIQTGDNLFASYWTNHLILELLLGLFINGKLYAGQR